MQGCFNIYWITMPGAGALSFRFIFDFAICQSRVCPFFDHSGVSNFEVGGSSQQRERLPWYKLQLHTATLLG